MLKGNDCTKKLNECMQKNRECKDALLRKEEEVLRSARENDNLKRRAMDLGRRLEECMKEKRTFEERFRSMENENVRMQKQLESLMKRNANLMERLRARGAEDPMEVYREAVGPTVGRGTVQTHFASRTDELAGLTESSLNGLRTPFYFLMVPGRDDILRRIEGNGRIGIDFVSMYYVPGRSDEEVKVQLQNFLLFLFGIFPFLSEEHRRWIMHIFLNIMKQSRNDCVRYFEKNFAKGEKLELRLAAADRCLELEPGRFALPTEIAFYKDRKDWHDDPRPRVTRYTITESDGQFGRLLFKTGASENFRKNIERYLKGNIHEDLSGYTRRMHYRIRGRETVYTVALPSGNDNFHLVTPSALDLVEVRRTVVELVHGDTIEGKSAIPLDPNTYKLWRKNTESILERYTQFLLPGPGRVSTDPQTMLEREGMRRTITRSGARISILDDFKDFLKFYRKNRSSTFLTTLRDTPNFGLRVHKLYDDHKMVGYSIDVKDDLIRYMDRSIGSVDLFGKLNGIWKDGTVRLADYKNVGVQPMSPEQAMARHVMVFDVEKYYFKDRNVGAITWRMRNNSIFIETHTTENFDRWDYKSRRTYDKYLSGWVEDFLQNGFALTELGSMLTNWEYERGERAFDQLEIEEADRMIMTLSSNLEIRRINPQLLEKKSIEDLQLERRSDVSSVWKSRDGRVHVAYLHGIGNTFGRTWNFLDSFFQKKQINTSYQAFQPDFWKNLTFGVNFWHIENMDRARSENYLRILHVSFDKENRIHSKILGSKKEEPLEDIENEVRSFEELVKYWDGLKLNKEFLKFFEKSRALAEDEPKYTFYSEMAVFVVNESKGNLTYKMNTLVGLFEAIRSIEIASYDDIDYGNESYQDMRLSPK